MEETAISLVDISGIHEYFKMEMEILALELELLKLEFKGALNDYT